MRDILTALASAAILVILVALFGPMMVNWNGQRAFVESKLTALMGQTVRVQGAIDLRLLPTPVLSLADIRWGEDGNRPVFSAETLTLEIATGPLLKGKIQIIDASLEAGRLDLRYDKAGGLALLGGLAPDSGAHAVAVERFALKRSTVLIEDETSGGGMILTGLDLELQAGALQGPWRISGRGALDGRPVDVRLSTSAPEADASLRLVASLAEEGGRSLYFDGRVQPDDHKLAGQLTWVDRYLLQGEKGLETRTLTLTTQVQGAGRRFTLDALEIDGGPDTGLKLSGTGELTLEGAPRLALDLSARALDLDFPVTGKQGGAQLPEIVDAWTRLARSVMQGRLSLSRIETSLTLKTQSLTLGGESLRDLVVSGVIGPQGGRVNRFSLGLPGRGQVTASGTLGRMDDPRFSGPVQVSIEDAPRFTQWLQGHAPQGAQPLGALRRVQFEGEVTLSPDMQAARIKSLQLDQSVLSGFVRLNAAERDQRARLEAQIGSERLQVDDLPDLSPLMAGLGLLDTQIAVEARSITLGGETTSGRLTASLSGDAKGLRIDRLDYDDGHDTMMRGGGQISEAGGRLGLHIEAKRLRLLSGLVSRLLPPEWATAVVRRSVEWAPLSVDLVLEQKAGRGGVKDLSLTGQAAGTQLVFEGTLPAQGGLQDGFAALTGQLRLSHPSFAVLLRQLGFAVPVPVVSEAGQLLVTMDAARGRSAVRFEAAGLGVDLTLVRGSSGLTGGMQVKGDNILPLAQALGFAAQGLEEAWPVALKGPLRWQDQAFGFGPLTGEVKQRPVSGDLVLMPERNRIEGRLGLNALALEDVASLVTGPIPASTTGSFWPSARFGDTPVKTVDLAIGLTLDQFTLGRDLALASTKLLLKREGETLSLQLQEGLFGTGQISGQLNLRRDGGRLGATLRLGAKDLVLADLWGAQNGINGQIGLALDIGSSGDSVADLISHSNGAGTLVWRQGQIAALDPQALLRVIETSRGMPDLAQLRATVGRELQHAPFTFEKVEAPLTMSDGVMRISSLAIAQEAASLQVSGVFDLRSLATEARVGLIAKPPRVWKGPAPDLQLSFTRAPEGGLLRELNVTSLYALLTTRAVETETDRLLDEQKKKN